MHGATAAASRHVGGACRGAVAAALRYANLSLRSSKCCFTNLAAASTKKTPTSVGSSDPTAAADRRSSVPISAFNQPRAELTQLPNGIRVASQRLPFSETITVGVWIDSGSRFDRKSTNGAAHFLEHMAFKGTKKRSRIQLEQEIENMGAHLNAYTSREQTVYYAKAFKKDLPQCLDILSDILLNSTIDKEALEVEKRVILREMEEVEKQTEEVIFDRLHMTAFRDSPLGFTILGSAENVEKMQREDLLDYIARNYSSSRVVVAAAGEVDHRRLVDLVQWSFANLPPPKPQTIALPNPKPFFCGSELIYRDDDMGPIAHIAVGFEGVPWKSPDVVAFMLMQAIIGSYRKHEEGLVPGKLSANTTVRNIATKMQTGCAEMFSAFNTCYRDTGLFGFYAQCDEVAVEHCVLDLMHGITALSYSVTDEEVERAKAQLTTQLLGHLDSTTSVAEDLGRQILVYGRHVPTAEFLMRLNAIDADEIKRVAWKYLHDKEVAVSAMGPLHGMPQLIDIRRATYWLRY
ncbi:mitochondrial-processing peptidase beta subunit, putative [Eimeria tenella]|uniref:Mitochondrial-processing peptidase beta subunit, putative n=2 Tax=Eimeria tenella TaxID=5802 RepID=U6KT33_EIMTE|nr:mitochondrial-processing peptidase beta subunit, putative [Eimeria tenella]CDJ41282.1 mitochondrial-processing peptidase beta subunit, putative [Eimeria tenella]|eukprot:XP_013232032.1 mitochondrial-processing peptidase beta subunit, putative [Eimeria tenella]